MTAGTRIALQYHYTYSQLQTVPAVTKFAVFQVFVGSLIRLNCDIRNLNRLRLHTCSKLSKKFWEEIIAYFPII
jgi:hypothetical protein